VQRLVRDGRDESRDPALELALRAHLGTCARCADYARDLELLHEMVQELPAAEPSAAFDWRLRLRLAKADAGELPPLDDREPAPRRSWWQFGFSAAAAAVLVVVVGLRFEAEPDAGIPGPAVNRSVGTSPSGAGRVFPVSDGRFYGPLPPPSYSYFIGDATVDTASASGRVAADSAAPAADR
jgi:hypothetical protein